MAGGRGKQRTKPVTRTKVGDKKPKLEKAVKKKNK